MNCISLQLFQGVLHNSVLVYASFAKACAVHDKHLTSWGTLKELFE
jgi:hypothetical protein